MEPGVTTKTVSLIIPINPVGWTAPFVGKRGAFTPKKYTQFKKIVGEFLALVYKEEPFAGEVVFARCEFNWYKETPQNKFPDLSNLLKAVEDCLKKRVIEDDKQVVEFNNVKKRQVDSPSKSGILIDLVFK